ncbi:MAG: hypothetical protein K6T83_07845 [Alicyclobacillus sp.]|nr:hypothetical protein [Alicyclobacillus sp.]
MFHVRDLYGVIGAMLLLVLIYLVLTHWAGTQALLQSTFSGSTSLFKTLQGR